MNQFFGILKTWPEMYNRLSKDVKDILNNGEPDVCMQAAVEIIKLREQAKMFRVVL
jgi:hypothetical protein